ncbi:MAG: hypothetical protein M3O36_08795 [Myxococcota bacterium]|nr:hypothetical protein [Myxococcota bacterium]
MNDQREPSHPPSAPPLRRPRGFTPPEDRHGRVLILAAWVLGLVLVALGLYVWRRPQAAGDAAEPGGHAEGEATSPSAAPAAPPEGGARSPLIVSDARVLGCHDRGPKKTPPDQCDHLPPVEQALASAIAQSVACVPQGSAGDGGGSVSGQTIEYVADVSFSRHRVSLTLPRAGRSLNDRKVLAACAAGVQGALRALALQGIDHQHARYEIAVTATYGLAARGT